MEGGGGEHQKRTHASEPLNIYSGPHVPTVKVKQPSGLPPGGGGQVGGDQRTMDLSVVLFAFLSLSILPHLSTLQVSVPHFLYTGRRWSQAAELSHQYVFVQWIFLGPAYKTELYSLLFLLMII